MGYYTPHHVAVDISGLGENRGTQLRTLLMIYTAEVGSATGSETTLSPGINHLLLQAVNGTREKQSTDSQTTDSQTTL